MSLRLAALGLLLLGGVAAARSVSTGTTAKVARKASFAKMSLYWSSGYGDQLEIVAYPAFVEEGDEFEIVDTTGYVGRARVTSTRKTNDGCPKFTYMRAQAEFIGKPARDSSYSTRIAVGPITKGRDRQEKAKFIDASYGTVRDVKDLPPPGASTGLTYTVDLDGDGAVDVARYVHDCSSARLRYNPQAEGCVDDWVKDGNGAWVLGETGRFRCH